MQTKEGKHLANFVAGMNIAITGATQMAHQHGDIRFIPFRNRLDAVSQKVQKLIKTPPLLPENLI